MDCFDQAIVKYGAFLFGHVIVGIPVFGKNREAYLERVKKDPALITKDYINNSNMFKNLA